MKTSSMRRALVFLLLAWAASSVYVYARFTVDDAFITWRYGKNLVEHGVWNYNPSGFDPTQAYTNPLYAALGIAPQLLGCDVVLFFKLFSVLLYGLVAWWLMRLSGPDWPLAVVLVGLPATVVHAFGGLETLLYGFLVAVLLVDLHRGRFARSLCWTVTLFMVRPESWVLAIAVPIHWLIAPRSEAAPGGARPALDWSRAVLAAAAVGVPLAAYFALHHHLFGEFLPNTFFAKAKGVFVPRTALICCLVCAPLLTLLGRRTLGLALVCALLFGGAIVSYSTAHLQMNYAGRFAFHLFFPAFCLGLYARRAILPAAGLEVADSLRWIRRAACSTPAMVALALAFFVLSGRYPDYCSTYYQRSLAAHVALGKALKSAAPANGIRAVAVGDAGVIAYHGDLPILDTVGLGSRLLTKSGPGPALFQAYNVDVAIFFTKDGEVDRDVYKQGVLLDWAVAQGMRRIGDLFWQDDYDLAIYAHKSIPELVEVCARSRAANVDVSRCDYWHMVLSPPWTYWHD